MSSTPPKRSRSARPGKKEASRSRSKSAKKAAKKEAGKRQKSRGADGKKRKAAGKEGRRAPSAAPKAKRQKVAKGEKEAKEPKEPAPEKAPHISARKIEVDYKTRMMPAVRQQPFRRMVTMFAAEAAAKHGIQQIRLSNGVCPALQDSAEENVVAMMNKASVLAMHAKRTTVQEQDITMTGRLQGGISDESDRLVSSILTKRVKKDDAGGAGADDAKANEGKPPKAPKAPRKAAGPKKKKDEAQVPAASDAAPPPVSVPLPVQ
jgi:histone H3/H4